MTSAICRPLVDSTSSLPRPIFTYPPRAIRWMASVTAGAEIAMCFASRAPITGLPLPARS
jgi:hypothetical protein